MGTFSQKQKLSLKPATVVLTSDVRPVTKSNQPLKRDFEVFRRFCYGKLSILESFILAIALFHSA